MICLSWLDYGGVISFLSMETWKESMEDFHKDWPGYLLSLSFSLSFSVLQLPGVAWAGTQNEAISQLLQISSANPVSLFSLFCTRLQSPKVSIAVKTICFNYEMPNIRLSLSCFTCPTLVTLSGGVLCSNRHFIVFIILICIIFLNECSSYLSCLVENVGLILHWYKVAWKSDYFEVAPT